MAELSPEYEKDMRAAMAAVLGQLHTANRINVLILAELDHLRVRGRDPNPAETALAGARLLQRARDMVHEVLPEVYSQEDTPTG